MTLRINRGVVIGVGLLLASAFYAFTQQLGQNSLNPQPPAQRSPETVIGPRSLHINLETWEVSSPDYSPEELEELNTLERRAERALIAQAILNPVKTGTRPGRTAEEVNAEAAAAFAITHPGLQDLQRQPTPEQIQAYERAKESILNPRVAE